MGERAKMIVNDYTALQLLKNKELDLDKFYGADLKIFVKVAQQEIVRLNNIINELEKSWKEQQEYYRHYKDNRYRTFLSKNLDKLKELKEGNK